MSGPSLHFALPSWQLFKFAPDDLPPVLPPPSPLDQGTFKSPVAVDFNTYNKALDPKVPMTVASCYLASVIVLNYINARRGNKPWAISKTRVFKAFVVLHNVALAVYSAVTCAAMLRAITQSWPGIDTSAGLAGAADSLCKLHGPRGLGDAATFNTVTRAWEVKNRFVKLLPGGTPDPTDVGRLWNEGLAFWGWLFYLSKFYEVVDTLIIIAKGKRCQFLQMYHHFGAMFCMWAGMRYMSPPIWMFVFLNSGIHAMMYTYYTLAAVGYRVPNSIKRTLTTLQITQFVFGSLYAAAHLFVKYDIPVQTAYTTYQPISSLSSSASQVVASATSSVIKPAVETYGAFVKRLLLRAAGEEGIAENVRDHLRDHVVDRVKEAASSVSSAAASPTARYREETRYSTEYTTIDCIDTTGESFAIWLNLLYLAPLTWLFVRFFVNAYSHRSHANPQSKSHAAGRSAVEAAKGVKHKVNGVGKSAESKLANVDEEVKRDLKALKEGKVPDLGRGSRPVGDRVESYERKVSAKSPQQSKSSSNTPKKDVKAIKQELADSIDELKENVTKSQQEAKAAANKTANVVDDLKTKAGDSAREAKQEATGAANGVTDKAKQQTANAVDALKNNAAESKREHTREAADAVDDLKDRVKQDGTSNVTPSIRADAADVDHTLPQFKKPADSELAVPSTDASSAPSTPSKKKKRRNKKKKSATSPSGADGNGAGGAGADSDDDGQDE